MPGTYDVLLTDTQGNPVDSLNDFSRLQLARSFNNEGNLSIVVPMRFAPRQIRRDFRIHVMRSVDNNPPSLLGDTFWLVNSVTFQPEQNTISIQAKDLMWILRRRIVGYTAQTGFADKTQEELGNGNHEPIDDMMKGYMRENFGALALDTTRDIDFLIISANRSLAPKGEKQAAFQQILAVLQDLTNMSARKGVPLFFDIRVSANGNIRFQIFRDFLKTDRGSNSMFPLILTNDRLNNINVTWDYTNEVNYIFATGSGSGAGIVLVEDGDDTRIASSPWGAMEAHLDLRDADEDSGNYIPDEIEAALYEGRPRLIMLGNVVDGPGAVFGLDFFYGDRVVAQIDISNFGFYSFDCLINAFTVTVDENREQVDISVRGESVI